MADVVGYTRLMEGDDSGTFSRLRNIRDEVVDPAIVSHGGRIVKTAGDGLVAEFTSALAALRAAVQVQREMAKRNADVRADQRIEYRIGINLGDVMVDGADLAGDGINVAARLETLAEAGGICVSSAVREQVHGNLDIGFEDIGDQQVKNIARPIRAYSVTLTSDVVGRRDPHGLGLSSLHSRFARVWRRADARRSTAVALLLVALAAGIGTAWWRFRSLPPPGTPALSVGLVPLAGATENPASSALRESLTRDIGTQLARASSVIRIVPAEGAPNAVKQPASAVREIAERAHVRYLLDGDVRQGNGVVELRVRLVDGTTGEQRWTETIVLRDPTEAFEARRALRAAMGHFADRLWELELQRASMIDEGVATPTELVLRARAMRVSGTTTSLQVFRLMETLCETALRREPELLAALRCIGNALDGQLDLDSNIDRARLIARMDEVSSRAVNLNRGSSADWDARSGVLMMMGRWDAALEASARAVELDPDGAGPLEGRAWIMTMVGKPAEAVRLSHEVIARDPPGDWWVIRAQCEALLLLGEYAEAVAACEKAAGRSGVDFDIAYFLAAAYAHTGNSTRAREEATKILKGAPGFTIATLKAKQYSTHPDYMRLAEEHWYSGLRKAGIPEK